MKNIAIAITLILTIFLMGTGIGETMKAIIEEVLIFKLIIS